MIFCATTLADPMQPMQPFQEGELFREEVAEFWCVSPWTLAALARCGF